MGKYILIYAVNIYYRSFLSVFKEVPKTFPLSVGIFQFLLCCLVYTSQMVIFLNNYSMVKKLPFRILNNSRCASGSGGFYSEADLTWRMMCAEEIGLATCVGDNGSPLLVKVIARL